MKILIIASIVSLTLINFVKERIKNEDDRFVSGALMCFIVSLLSLIIYVINDYYH